MRAPGATTVCFDKRMKDGTYDKYCQGHGIDIGGAADPLKIPGRTIDLWDKEQGDAEEMLDVQENKYDFVYASHIIEHLDKPIDAIGRWIEICRERGFIFIVFPDFRRYEKLGEQRFNKDHKHYFSLDPNYIRRCKWIPELLEPDNFSIEVYSMRVNDDGYDYSLPDNIDQTRTGACAHIEVILRKNG